MYRTMTTARLIATIVLLVILGVVFAITVSNNKKIINRCASSTTGVVTEYTPRKSRKRTSSTYGTITVAYEVKGVQYSCRGTTSGTKTPGNHVTVHYDPTSPSIAYADRGPVVNQTPMYAAIGVAVVIYVGVTVFLGNKSSY